MVIYAANISVVYRKNTLIDESMIDNQQNAAITKAQWKRT